MGKITTTRFKARKRLIVAAISACFASAPAWSNPTAPQVVNGNASFSQAGKLLTVTNSPGAIINWNSFSINAGETTRFNQASASSSVLNRVLANDPSQLLGTLSSNGKVWLVNPAGIMVGPGARIDVAAFVASTLNIRNEDFLAGRLNFQATPNAGKVDNFGQISTPSGGSVFLIGSAVTNNGIINAPNGDVILAAGQTVQLVDTGTPGVKVDITGAEGDVTNLGQIAAEAGRIGMAGVLVKNSGTLNASSLVKEGGRVFLKASKDTYVEGQGRITATGTKGGSIEVLGNRVAVTDQAQLDASGTAGGGTVLVGGDAHGANPEVQNANITYFGPQALIKADAASDGDGGKVIVWADDTTRAYGTIQARGGARGGNGGFVETSGKRYLDVTRAADVSASTGRGGTWLLDPSSLEIVGSGGSTVLQPTSTGAPDFTVGSNVSKLASTTINAGLASGDITITAFSGDDINFDASPAAGGAISITNASGGSRTLTLSARDITFNGGTTTFQSTLGGSIFGIKFQPGSGRKIDVRSGGTVVFNGLDSSSFVAGYMGNASTGVTWENAGVVTLSGVSYIDLYYSASTTFNNNAGGTLNLGSTQGWAIQSLNPAQAEPINNAGIVNVTASTSIEAAYSQSATGILNIANGQFLNLQNANVLSGTINIGTGVGTGSSLNLPEVHGGARTFSGAAINQAGALTFSANPVTFTNTKLSYTGGAGDYTIPAGITYSGDVSYAASRNLTVSSSITTVGNVALRADSGGTGTGTIIFTGGGSVALSGGVADLYYNPTSYTDVATKSDAGFNPYSSTITGPYTAWMLVNDLGPVSGGTLGLQAMNINLSGRYALGKDVNASATTGWNSGAGFVPVGSSATKFTGKFDGQGHTISGLFENSSSVGGLFGYTETGSVIRNVGLIGGSITGGVIPELW